MFVDFAACKLEQCLLGCKQVEGGVFIITAKQTAIMKQKCTGCKYHKILGKKHVSHYMCTYAYDTGYVRGGRIEDCTKYTPIATDTTTDVTQTSEV